VIISLSFQGLMRDRQTTDRCNDQYRRLLHLQCASLIKLTKGSAQTHLRSNIWMLSWSASWTLVWGSG